ncbi:MAG TPA: hypothetical protein VFE47_31515 [Tepidisphaeraceae bacterium]|jgi:hypothetical protein|nr:hypothetical protein [Tepidisphaeraceae bacterium]
MSEMHGELPTILPEMTVASLRGSHVQIPFSQIEMISISDFWDGPLMGMAGYAGQVYWYNIIAPSDGEETANPGFDGFGEPRAFALFQLTEAQLREEQRWHSLFEEKVGTHWSCKREARGELKPASMHREFFEPASKRDRLDLRSATVVGWFEMP